MMNRFLDSMMMIMTILGLSLLCSCVGVKSTVVKEEETVAEGPEPDQLVARVASVNKAANYVLIQRYGRLVVPENSILYAFGGEGQAASIKLTGERLGQFLAADIVSGELSVGDAVYLRVFEEEGESEIEGDGNLVGAP